MYINFKSKYKKIIWLLIGFILACICVHKVNALTIYTENDTLTLPDIPSGYNDKDFVIWRIDENTTVLSILSSTSGGYYDVFLDSNTIYFAPTHDLFLLSGNNWTFLRTDAPQSGMAYSYLLATSVDIYGQNETLLFNANYGLAPISSLPDYLNGYQKITLTTSDKYYMLSGLSSGSVFIPIEDFNFSGGRLSYYDNDLSSQPYTSYIQDYTITRDGLYARQDFDLNNYYGADWVMFSKYIYLEGEDNLTYDIWVPEDITYSDVTITPNSSGGNNFDFQYKDGQGTIQNGQIISVDLSQNNPLLGNIFADFSSNTFGLTSIVTAPLSLISSLSSTSCSNLSVPLPYISANLTLPCMSSIYSNTFGSFFTLYQTITTGIISYWVIVKIFNLVKDFKNPDHDEIEVIDL